MRCKESQSRGDEIWGERKNRSVRGEREKRTNRDFELGGEGT